MARKTSPKTRALKAIYDRGMDAGWHDDDFIGLVRLLEPVAAAPPNETSSG